MEINVNINQALIMIGELYARNRLLADELETRTIQLAECGRECDELRAEIASLRQQEPEVDAERAVFVHHVES